MHFEKKKQFDNQKKLLGEVIKESYEIEKDFYFYKSNYLSA